MFNIPENKNYAIFKRVLGTIIVLILLLVSFGSGLYLAQKNEVVKDLANTEVVYLGKLMGKYSNSPSGKLSQDIDFKEFWNVWDALRANYVDKEKINEKELFYGAIKGMVASVGDPYTIYMDPKISKQFTDDLAGTFEGIGAEIGMKNNVLTIIAPLPDMPAEKAGLRSGDKILAIDKITTSNLSIDEAVSKIRGQKGTEVTLTILRDGQEKPKDFILKRDKIIVKSVRKKYVDNDNIMVIEITNFNDDTAELFNSAANEAMEKNPKAIILDLRNNPGGYLETAVKIASMWLEKGDVVVTEQKTSENKKEFLAEGRQKLKDFKTVVLVNQGSASASEIVAGALQDKKKATVVGKQTFGKGSVQSLESFSDGSSLKVTVAKWLTPNGNNINEKGILPDVEVDLTEKDYNDNKDPQMDKAIEILKGKK